LYQVEHTEYFNPAGLSFSRITLIPFTIETTIEYFLSEPCKAVIRIFNLNGNTLRILNDNNEYIGFHNIKWDGKDKNGNMADPGIYFYRIETSSGQIETNRMIFLK